MNKIIFFDLDQTLYNHDTNEVPSQTIKLLKMLSKQPNVRLGLATGRSLSKLQMIKPFIAYFEFLVLVNGGVVYKNNEIVFDYPIDISEIQKIQKEAEPYDINVGMVGDLGEAFSKRDHRISFDHVGFHSFDPDIDPYLYSKCKIYQLWLIANDFETLDVFAANYPNYNLYYWRRGGGDFIYKTINKGSSIKKLLKDEIYDQLICIGDGFNDIEMIELADIGIAMKNSKSEELIKKADLIAPHIDDNQLLDFFLAHHLI